jgi:uncharacterized cupredoxin-like copper-binding protein
MDARMRFTPDTVSVQAGESIRFVVYNDGTTAHECVLGTSQDIAPAKTSVASHAHGAGVDAGAGAVLRIEAGKVGEIVATFPAVQTLKIACLTPGQVGNAPVPDAAPASAHANHTHKH